jgi:hypothetical protein
MSAACAATAVASIGTAAKAPTIILCPLFRLEDVWFLDRAGAPSRANALAIRDQLVERL